MDATTHLLVRFRAQDQDVPKHARLRAAFVDAVRAGELRSGTKIIGERDLSQALGLSLGTTQKALSRLVDEGFLVRRQGHGTFVGAPRRPVSGNWHYRFLASDGQTELPVFATLIERKAITADGPWTAALGPEPDGYVLLRRRLDIGGAFACSSTLVLPASRFAKLLRASERRLSDHNLKQVLETDFAAPTLSASGIANVVAMTPDDARVIGVARGTMGLQIDIVGRSFGHAPITFQRMIVPPTRHPLKLDFPPPDAQDGGGDARP